MLADKNKMAVDVFNACATEYHHKYMNVDLYHSSLDFFCAAIPATNANILDVACGPGNVTQYLLHKHPTYKILGIDLAPNMVSLAKENNSTANFMVMDCRDIATLEQKFDAIICAFCLPYLSKEEAVQLIADAAFLLNKKGVVYISTMEDDYANSGMVKSSSGQYELYMYFHQMDYLKEALELNGLTILHTQQQQYPTPAPTKIIDLILIARK